MKTIPTSSWVRLESSFRETPLLTTLMAVITPPALAIATPTSSKRLKRSPSQRPPPTTRRPRPALRSVAVTGMGASARDAASATQARLLKAMARSQAGRLASAANKRSPDRPGIRIPSRFSSAAAPALNMPDRSASRLPMTSMTYSFYRRDYRSGRNCRLRTQERLKVGHESTDDGPKR